MKEIVIYLNGRLAAYTQVDDEDFEELNQYLWHMRSENHSHLTTNYAVRNNENKNEDNQPHAILMHRQIMGITNPREFVDHIDHNGLNNQKSNLRITDYVGNGLNRKQNMNATYSHKGITFNKKDKTFVARIQKNKMRYQTKPYKTEVEVVEALHNLLLELELDPKWWGFGVPSSKAL